jgi:hypothetical protein
LRHFGHDPAAHLLPGQGTNFTLFTLNLKENGEKRLDEMTQQAKVDQSGLDHPNKANVY